MTRLAMPRAASLGAALLLLASACPEDRDPAPQVASTSSAGGSDSTASPPDLPEPAGSTGPGWPLPTDDELLTCVRTCEGPWDCCPPGTAGICPGPAFPYNYMCIAGLCVSPPCTSSGECVEAGEVCVEIRGAPRCVTPCAGDGDDAPCAAVGPDHTCSGLADDDRHYCFEHCSNPAVFCTNEICDEVTGECVCTSAGQCQSSEDCV